MAFRKVVFPAPVAPEIITLARCATNWRNSFSNCGCMELFASKSPSSRRCCRCFRSEIKVPSAAIGGSTACRRIPEAKVPSTIGLASSSRCPQLAASRTARARTPASLCSCRSATGTFSSPRPLSTQTCPAPFTSTSVVSSSSSNGISVMPAPASSVRTRERILANSSV